MGVNYSQLPCLENLVSRGLLVRFLIYVCNSLWWYRLYNSLFSWMQSIPCEQDSTQMCWESDTLRFFAHCQSMPLSDYLGQEEQALSCSSPSPPLGSKRGRKESSPTSEWCFMHNPGSLWGHRLPLWGLPIHVGSTLRPITHTLFEVLLQCTETSAWMLDSRAVDGLVQLLDAAMRPCLHLRKTIQWKQSQLEVKIVPWWKCVGLKVEIFNALRE